MKPLDLKNERFGSLIAIKRVENNKNSQAVWLCKCDCGNFTNVIASKLKSNAIKSCGCKRKLPWNDLTGQRFGKLVVIKIFDRIRPGRWRWECICDCGNKTYADGLGLKQGTSVSCGCIGKLNKFTRKESLNDLKGQKFGRLLVISLYSVEKHRAKWLCKCDCGNEHTVLGTCLMQGYVRSCGCLNREARAKRSGPNNHNYNPLLTDEERLKGRDLKVVKIWASDVLRRDNYTCIICGKRGGKLVAHHLDGWNWNISGRFVISNGVCLCSNCHYEFHKMYGLGNNTREQFNQFTERV